MIQHKFFLSTTGQEKVKKNSKISVIGYSFTLKAENLIRVLFRRVNIAVRHQFCRSSKE